MLAKIQQLLLFGLLMILILGFNRVVLADVTTDSASLGAQQTELQQQLQEIEAQIAQFQQELKNVQGQKNTLQNKVNQLKKQQATLNLQIKATTLQLNSLAGQLTKTQVAIVDNQTKSEKLKAQMAETLQLIYQRDNTPVWYTLISGGTLADVFTQVEDYLQLSQSLTELLNETKAVNGELEKDQQTLADQQDEANNLLSIQNLQKQGLNGSLGEQNDLLLQTKGQESNYKTILSDAQKQAQTIRGRIYQLFGVSDNMTFGQAVQIAEWAGGQTGVRAAFLLAVLTQESNLGKNVGTCNRVGDPPTKSWKVIMKPKRDQEPFKQITSELGLNIDTTPVSCPMRDKNGNQIGWGGAMGPAQFIPSTWVGYRDKITAVTGKTANPWDIRDAFLAASLKLAAGGATTVAGEWAAAMRYFSGSTNSKYSFYGDSVVAQTAKYQSDIETLGR